MTDAPDFLSVLYEPDPGDIGRVRVEASADGYAGWGRCWQYAEAITEFAQRLRAYPIDPADPPTLVGGYGARADGSVGAFDTVHLVAQPIGSLGQVAVYTTLAGDLGSAVDDYRPMARLVLQTTYERLRLFAEELDGVAVGTRARAFLEGERLGYVYPRDIR